jgi:hypothetical protein
LNASTALRGRLDSQPAAAPVKAVLHRILVVCEGKVTEPRYFRELQHAFRNRLVHVEIDKQAGVPLTVVNRALAMDAQAKDDAKANQDDNLKYDEVWCVFDVDEHPNLAKALELAKSEGFEVALSNPCFELWALLHFKDQFERVHRHEVQHAIKEFLPNCDKELDFRRLHAGYAQAVRRADLLQRQADATSNPRRNPSTSVFRLTERIRTGG